MIIHALVEGPSEDALLVSWLPRLMKGHTIRVYPHQGKGKLPTNSSKKPDLRQRGLLDQLPAKLAAFESSGNHEEDVVLVLVDADDDDYEELIEKISSVAQKVAPNVRVLVKVAVEETEAFYLGDLRALGLAYPNADMKKARKYSPDSICGTWELFGQIIGDDGGNKVAWAEAMGPRLTVVASKSRSPSFQEKRRRFRHVARTMKKKH
jgi:Domain of unknown function (DUF4276)